MRFATTLSLAAALLTTALASGAQPASEPSPSQAEPAPEQAAPEQAAPDAPKVTTGRRFALVTGVQKAEIPGIEAHELEGCTRDANALASRLTQSGYTVTRLTEANNDTVPTLAAFMSTLQSICTNAGPTDLVLVYISSHGGVLNDRPMLLLKDAPVFLDDIKEELSKSRALVRMIFLDACRDQPGFPTQTREYRDIHTVLSCRPDEYSLATEKGLSVFTQAIIDGLNGCKADRVKDGRIELDELLYYLDEHVPVLADQCEPGHKQRPTRTVVDPRAVNPVIATCSILDQLMLPEDEPNAIGLTGVEGPVARGPHNDLILPSDLGELVKVGMTREEIAASLSLELDKIDAPAPSGDDIVIIDDRPFIGDTFYVFFKDAKLTKWFIMMRNPCVSGYSATASRAMFMKLVGNDTTADVTPLLKGKTRGEMLALLGCPSQIFCHNVNATSHVYEFNDVPVEGMQLNVVLKSDVVESVHIDEVKK